VSGDAQDAAMPRVVALSPESRVASTTEPTAAATTDATTTASRKRRCGSRAAREGGHAYMIQRTARKSPNSRTIPGETLSRSTRGVSPFAVCPSAC
jgi:hypothetical protein